MYILKTILLALFIVAPMSAEALTDREIKKVWYRYVEKLKDAGIACIYTKAELADMFVKMDVSFPKTEPGKTFATDRNRLSGVEEGEFDKLIPVDFKNSFFANERTNTRLSERNQIRRKMKLLALEALNEIRSPKPFIRTQVDIDENPFN